KASPVRRAYYFPRGLNHDAALGSVRCAARKLHFALKCLLPGLRVKRVRLDVVEHRFVHQNFIARVVAVLIDEWASVERLAEVSQHGRCFSNLTDDSHSRFVAGFALRGHGYRSVVGRRGSAGQEDVSYVAVVFPHRVVVAVLADRLVWIAVTVRTRRPVEGDE